MSKTHDTTSLARMVPQLAPEALHRLIQHRGLDACGELVTSATPAQLTSLLDLDLWRRAAPARDEAFDAGRFGEWLDLLVEAGDSVAARTIASLDQHMVTAGLSRHVRVFDPGTFEPTASSDDEPVDRHGLMSSETSADALECEVGGYLVRARRTDAWDAIVALLVALDAAHGDEFHALMQGCRRLSNSAPEIDGLDDLLTAPEQHLQDVAFERERRRSGVGYATPADARAFLQMARQRHVTRDRPNPIAAAYFRAVAEGTEPIPEDTPADAARPAAMDPVIELLTEAGAMPERPRALLESGGENPGAAQLTVLRRLLTSALRHDEAAYLTRCRELGFLANTLVAGCSVQSRPFTPAEAFDAAASICNLGLECSDAAPLADAFLVDHDLVIPFETGWAVLYDDVSLFVADELVATLTDLRGVDADTRRELHALERTIVTHREAGTPWLAREAADVLAMLDVTAWASVLGLLDECPVVPAALTAVLEGRTTSVSPTAFQFISTRAQIGDIRVFMRMLPGVLSG